MLYYALLIHFVWALYALFVNQNINEKNGVSAKWYKNVLAFVMNFIGCPIAIAVAAFNEYNGDSTLL